MAPLRSRANRNQGDDETSILKGLPIRQWRLTEEKIGPPVESKPDLGKQIFPELPLPRDFAMLPEISQQLLRKARAGQIYHSPVAPAKDDKSKSGSGGTKDAEGVFVSKKWTLLARDKEAEEPNYLAKRRKGLPTTFAIGINTLVPQASYRTTKVKKYDAEGKLHVYEVLAPEGQQVEGEVVAEDDAAKAAPVEAVAAAPGTVLEGIGVVNEQGVVVSNDLLAQPTPPRRKPPPPRRKPKKGPGRGKKKVLFENGDPNNPTNPDGTAAAGLLNVPGVASERTTDSAVASSQGDTPMPDAGDDDEGSGSEGDEGDEGEEGREEGELSPSPEPEKAAAADANPEAPEDADEPAMPTTEIKEERRDDDAMDTDQQEPSAKQEEVAPAVEPAMAATDTTTLPGLLPLVAPMAPEAPAPPVETKTETPPVPLVEPAVAESAPEPPTSVPTTTETQIPGLPIPAPEPSAAEPEPEPMDIAAIIEPVPTSAPEIDAPIATEPAIEPLEVKPVPEPVVPTTEQAPPPIEPPVVVAEEDAAAAAAAAEKVHEDADVKTDDGGEVDLLGTLEATLDRKEGGEAAVETGGKEEKEEEKAPVA